MAIMVVTQSYQENIQNQKLFKTQNNTQIE